MRIFAGVAGAYGKHLKINNCGKILKFTSRTSSVAPLGNGRGRCEASGRGFPSDKGKSSEARGGESEANGVIYVYSRIQKLYKKCQSLEGLRIVQKVSEFGGPQNCTKSVRVWRPSELYKMCRSLEALRIVQKVSEFVRPQNCTKSVRVWRGPTRQHVDASVRIIRKSETTG
jgi:hypothetical protein